MEGRPWPQPSASDVILPGLTLLYTAIPTIFFGHGSPVLVLPDIGDGNAQWHSVIKRVGCEIPLANFSLYSLRTGKRKESNSVRQCADHLMFTLFSSTVTDYGDKKPLLMDSYNFGPEHKFSSRDDAKAHGSAI